MRAFLLAVAIFCAPCAFAQSNFDVATIKLSSDQVKFERDGQTTLSHGTLRMHDVTLMTCIKWAYHVQRAQVDGPEEMSRQHYDIVAKVNGDPTIDQVRAMLRGLLKERFSLDLHPGNKELNTYAMVIAPHGLRNLRPTEMKDGEPWHQNSASGMVAKNFSMQDFVAYISDPLGAPLVDETDLPGRYDFVIDFRPYLDEAQDIRADPQAVLKAALEGELGLRLIRKRTIMSTLVIDHFAAPTPD